MPEQFRAAGEDLVLAGTRRSTPQHAHRRELPNGSINRSRLGSGICSGIAFDIRYRSSCAKGEPREHMEPAV